MDTKKLLKAIKLIVENEVKKQLIVERKSMKESLLHELKQQSVKRVTNVVEKDPLDVDHLFETKKPQTQKPLFTKKSPLTEVLNETYQSGEWRNINSGGTFTSDMAQSFAEGNMMNQSTIQDSEGRNVSIDALAQTEAGASVVNALTRDYSQLMKVMNNKNKR
jgi:hypothetical protein